jgi:phage baseplate assembly protein W
MSAGYLDSPLHLDGRGRTASTDADDHVRDMVRAVLFTTPGERVNRPDFGCGLKTLVFAPAAEALAGATELMVRAALQRWLEQEILVDHVEVRSEESTLTVIVVFTRRDTGARVQAAFGSPLSGGGFA